MNFYNVISNIITHDFTQFEKSTFLAFKILSLSVFEEKLNDTSMNIHKSDLFLKAETALEVKFVFSAEHSIYFRSYETCFF